MTVKQRLILSAVVAGLGAWTVLPALGYVDPAHLPSLAKAIPGGALNELFARAAIFGAVLAGAVAVSRILGRLRWLETRASHLDELFATARSVVPLRRGQRDRYALIRAACGRLARTRGYDAAWIACVDANGRLLTAAQAGLPAEFGDLARGMKEGSWPPCAERALSATEPVVIRDTVSQCAECSLRDRRYGRSVRATRIEIDGKVLGVMCIKSPLATLEDKDEDAVIRRISQDLAYALSEMDLEEQHSESLEDLAWERAFNRAVAASIEVAASEAPLRDVAATVLDEAAGLFGGRAALAHLIDERSGTASVLARTGEWPEPPPTPRRGESGDYDEPWGRALNTGAPFSDRLPDDTPGGPRGARRLLAAPAIARDGVVGQILVVDPDKTAGQAELDAARRLAAVLATAVDRAAMSATLAVEDAEVEESPTASLVTDEAGEVVDVNRAFVRLWGFDSVDQAVGTRSPALWNDAGRFEAANAALAESGSWNGEIRARRADGTTVDVHASAALVPAAQTMSERRVWTITDLTGVRLDRARQDALARLAALSATADRPDDLFRAARQELGRVMETRNFLVALYDPETDGLTLPLFLDEKDQDQFRSLPAGRTLSALVVRRSCPLLASRPDIERLVREGEVEIVGSPCEAWMGVPLLESRGVVGVMAVQSYGDPSAYDADDLAVLAHAAGIVSSMIARRRAQVAHRESEGRFGAVAQTVSDALVDTDSHGHILSWNRAAEAIFGYSADEAIGQPFSIIVPEGFLQAHVDGLMRAVSAEGQGYVRASVEGVGLRKDESEFPMELSIGAWKTDDDTHFTAVLRDATTRKQTEEELLFLSSIPLQVSDALIVTDLNFRITYVNKAAEFLFAYSGEELIGTTLDLLSVESWEDRTRDEIHQTVSAGRVWSGTQKSRRKDGSTFYVEFRVSPLRGREGRLTSYISIFHDITERRRAQELLQTLNAAALAMERSITPGQILEAVGRELESIGLSCAVLLPGREPDQLTLRYASQPSPTDAAGAREPDDDVAIAVDDFAPLRRTVEQGRAVFLERTTDEAHTKLDEESAALVRMLSNRSSIIAPLITGESVTGVLSVLSDRLTRHEVPAVTAFANQLAAAWRKASLMEELEQSLTELKRAQSIILHAQKMEAIGNLAGGVAHDFNNLLTAISGYAELLLEELDPDASARGDVEEIRKAAAQAASVTSQLLAFSRQQPLEPRSVALNEVVKGIDKMLRRLIGEDVELVTVLDPDLDRVKADPSQLQQVIMNLAINSRDAMPDGGTLTIRTDAVTLSDDDVQPGSDARPGPHVRLTVADTGTGIDPRHLDRIFEPFFTTKDPGKGTGLGLSVVYGIVRQHGGWIDVASTEGKGTVFQVYLPVFEGEETAAESASQPAASARGRGERILIIEDEDAVRSFAVRTLAGNGYEVIEASSAEEALDLFAREGGSIDLIFSDVVLSAKSGVELVDELTQKNPGLRVLLSSGYADQKSQWSEIRERGFRFLKKPYAKNELLSTIRDLVDSN